MSMDGYSWLTCPGCGWYFKPGYNQEAECRCGIILTPEEIEEAKD